MKSMLRLTGFHTKRMLRSIPYLLMCFIIPMAVILLFHIFSSSEDGNPEFSFSSTVVVSHSDFVNQEVSREMGEKQKNKFGQDMEKALKDLENRDINLVYEIPKNFPDQAIKAYSINGKNSDPFWEQDFMEALKKVDEQKILQAQGVDPAILDKEVKTVQLNFDRETLTNDLFFLLMMVIFYMSMTTGVTAGDLCLLHKNQVLKRSISANAQSQLVLGSVLLGYTLAGLICSSLVVLFSSFLMGMSLESFPFIMLILLCHSFFLAGLNIFLFRYVKDENMIRFWGTILPLAFISLVMVQAKLGESSFVPKLSPFYWLMEAVDTGQVFPYLLVILLMGAVLFTAGSFKMERLLAVRD